MNRISWDEIEWRVAERLGGNPSYRLVRKLTGYISVILDDMGETDTESARFGAVLRGVCNAAIIGKEEL